jgi:thiol-disulfide isomerase/thioredoxin
MKKILLSACVFAIITSSVAQEARTAISSVKKTAKSQTKNISDPAVQSLSAPSAFFTNTFSNSGEWTAYSANGQDWVVGTTAPAGQYSSAMGAIQSTSAADGFAMFDSDIPGGSANNTQDATLTYNGTVDCSMYPGVKIAFESFHRKFQNTVFVEVSNDSWASFETFEVHASQEVNSTTANPESVSINISSVAGSQASVSFRFRYIGSWDYAWMVDDVSFQNLQDNDIEVISADIDGTMAGNRTANLIIRNGGANNVTSISGQYTFNGTTTPMNIAGINLSSGQTHTEPISLGYLNIGGPYAFSATVSNVNGGTDPDMSNNSISTSYTILEQIPNWTMTDSYGNSVTLHDELVAGKMIVLDFMASWCGPCESSTPELNTFYVNHTTNGMDNMNVFGITTESTDNANIVNNLGWGGTYPKFAYTAENNAQYNHYANALELNTEGYIPFFVMICPNKTDPGNSTIVKHGTGFLAGMFTNEYEPLFNQCPSADNTQSGSTDINEESSYLSVYPNPANNILNINGSYISLEIVDMFGKVVLATKSDSNLNVSSLADGIYMINILTEKGIQTQKITITK